MSKETVMTVVNFVRNKVLSAKGISLIVFAGALFFGYNLLQNRIVPMAYGAPEGANPTDIVGLILSGVTALVSFIISRYTGVPVKPEVIQAVVSFEKDPANPETQRRVAAAVFGYVVAVLKKHPEGSGGFVLQLLTMLVSSVDDPEIKNILSSAAKNVAENQFKPVEVPAS